MTDDENRTDGTGVRTKPDERRFGQPTLRHDEIGSTNTAALVAAQEGANEGTVITADRQTTGRGRGSRKWISEPGKGLYLSIILRPTFPTREINRLILYTAVAAAKGIEKLSGAEVGLKWPNDLFMGGKKVGGILMETSVTGQTISHAVIGIGINVLYEVGDFPDELMHKAGSIYSETGIRVERNELRKAILTELESYYYGRTECTIEDWKKRCIHIDRDVTVLSDNGSLTGRFAEVLDDLSFMLRKPDGTEKRIYYGEISLNLEGN